MRSRKALVLGLELPVGVQDLGQPVLGELRALLERVGRAGSTHGASFRWPE